MSWSRPPITPLIRVKRPQVKTNGMRRLFKEHAALLIYWHVTKRQGEEPVTFAENYWMKSDDQFPFSSP
jgi:hypothetical protein